MLFRSEFYKNTPWPNEYIPPTYDAPIIKFTVEENTEVSNLMTLLDTFTSEKEAAFIAGDESFDAWDEFMTEFESYELDRILEIYNAAAKRYFDAQ